MSQISSQKNKGKFFIFLLNWLPGADRADHVFSHRVRLRLGERDGGGLHAVLGVLAGRPRPPDESPVAEGDLPPVEGSMTKFLQLFASEKDVELVESFDN